MLGVECPRGTRPPSIPAEKLPHCGVAAAAHRLGVLAAVSGPGFKQRVWISAGVLARGLAAANTLQGLGFISRSPVLVWASTKEPPGQPALISGGSCRAPTPQSSSEPLAPLLMLPQCWWQGSNLGQGVFGDHSPQDGAEAAPGLNPLRVEELNPAQMAGGLRQPQICHKQMVMFQWLYCFFFFLLGGSQGHFRTWADLGVGFIPSYQPPSSQP